MEQHKILDSREEIAKIDAQNVLGSAEALADQCRDAWEKASLVEIPGNYSEIRNVVMCGMGGSGLGARFIESVFSGKLKVPLTQLHDYNLPEFVNSDTLVFCSSYSGTTEETVENANQAISRGAKWVAIGTGNTLIKLAQDSKAPFYRIDPLFNPSKQPRMAIGYSIIGQLVLASKAGLLKFSEGDISEITDAMKKVQEASKPEISFNQNRAKELSFKMKDKIVVFVASGHLVGATHTFNNQLNENAKNLSFDLQIPELNHHWMEGLKNPNADKSDIFVVFCNSSKYSDRIKKRYEVTMDVVQKNNLEYFEYRPESVSAISQGFELIQFGSYVNLYLSILYGGDPAPIPWVDYFKTQMGQPLGK